VSTSRALADEGIATVICRRRGQRWRLGYGGRSAIVGDSVGMVHLATLLANPGREIRALDLVTGPASPGDTAASAQPVLDDTAKKRYREHLARLEAEIEDYEALHDLEHAARLRAPNGTG
jgi:hypothetical protein